MIVDPALYPTREMDSSDVFSVRHHCRAALGLVMLLASCSRARSLPVYGLPPDMFRVDSPAASRL